ncbi:MAG: hypothetical protein NT062_19735 [Proteobacteria bacterium]|nr:hypothetical protein [Pseudomonadota bacterium]
MTTIWTVATTLVIGAAACNKAGKAGAGSGSGSTTTSPTPTPPVADPVSGSGSAATAGRAKAAVVEGAACAAGMSEVTDAKITFEGATLKFERSRGGGCATRPVYTVLYTKANPMPVRVCYDPGADSCEMMIQSEQVAIDLTDALKAAGATSAVLAK